MKREQLIEYLHDTGKMSDKYYYQVNGKTFEENYIKILQTKKQQRSQKIAIDKQVEEMIYSSLDDFMKRIFKP